MLQEPSVGASDPQEESMKLGNRQLIVIGDRVLIMQEELEDYPQRRLWD